MEESRVPSRHSVVSITDELVGWLRRDALTVWDRFGVDRRRGGYFETLEVAGNEGAPEAAGESRRGRVVARQIYVFDVGHRLGWRSPISSPLEHGCDYLFSRLYAGDGQFHTAVDGVSDRPRAPFSLYEQAFYLFALARLNTGSVQRYPITETALRCLTRLRAGYGRTQGGFEESNPPTLPLKSNPHMHLLEAALEWVDAASADARQPWIDLAADLVGLCLTHFRDPHTGAIREYFDYEWNPAPGDAGRIIEPGHQFEWAWLLLRWADLAACPPLVRQACTQAARRLVEIGENWGVDPVRGIALNEIWDDMSIKDAGAKLWPQTERLKAWCAMLDRADTDVDAERACHHIVIAARGMMKYLRAEAPGLWHEICSADGSFPPGPSKASSFYHVVCAIDALQRTAGTRGGSVVYSARQRADLS